MYVDGWHMCVGVRVCGVYVGGFSAVNVWILYHACVWKSVQGVGKWWALGYKRDRSDWLLHKISPIQGVTTLYTYQQK